MSYEDAFAYINYAFRRLLPLQPRVEEAARHYAETGDASRFRTLRDEITEQYKNDERLEFLYGRTTRGLISTAQEFAEADRGDKNFIAKQIYEITAIVLKKSDKFITLVEVDASVGTRVAVAEDLTTELSEFGVHYLKIEGAKQYREVQPVQYAIKLPGEADWETLERLGLPEENLLP